MKAMREAPTAEAAAHRRGHPAPLVFHLGAALAAYQGAVAAAPAAGSPGFPWHPDIDAPTGPSPLPHDVAKEALHRLAQIGEGIRAWQQHPYRREAAARPVLWQSGASRLLDFSNGNGGPVVLVVPSLINTADVLDLTPETSFLETLAAVGLAPVLLDWGAPGFAEAAFDLDRYITARLLPAWSFLEGRGGRRPALLGYCMGGTLAAALAAALPGAPGLVAIGAPWAFGGGAGLAADLRAGARQMGAARLGSLIEGTVQAFGLVPSALFEQLFAMIDPMQVARKFQRFATLDPGGSRAERFVAVEDWLADGRAMAGPAAHDLLVRWHLEDALALGHWDCLGRSVRPEAIQCPALIVTGRRDHIAPPVMAGPLAQRIPGAVHLEADLGHVGMIISRKARADVIEPVVAFLSALA